MSEATRVAALSAAVSIAPKGTTEASVILELAMEFDAFINASDVAKAAKAVKALTTKAEPEKVPTKKKTVIEPVSESEEAEDPKEIEEEADEEVKEDGPTKEQVGEAIEEMLNANLRDELKAMLKRYKATSLSSIPKEKYPAFLKEAAKIMATA